MQLIVMSTQWQASSLEHLKPSNYTENGECIATSKLNYMLTTEMFVVECLLTVDFAITHQTSVNAISVPNAFQLFLRTVLFLAIP